ncbi:acetyl-CoA C-acetyltransferase [Facklamia sp. DSM 111018]|uniref:acetyl-CoA C-acetyltransferase n=1 Tax=Facklamia lactis TaxID=2749967 RepID=A0ABS0LSS0_9LACT|nr:acetyl-CoA C-acetyltransferase [Facklamia lactis]MBG9981318.1 acetyl-CoA C-acetyltransferase [Facklamia lactis]MBG9987206.1 acetyl-CoA C-acetyltransferase [Facklamia lactis]
MPGKDVVIVSAFRTSIGKFGGSLKDISAVELGSKVLYEAYSRISLDPAMIDEVIIGNVLSAGLGQNIARQIAIQSGIPNQVSAYTVSQVCGSGMKSIMLGYQSILTGENQIVAVGGTENMSQAAYIIENARWGTRMGHSQLLDTMIQDGLTDAFEGYHMGITAENIAESYDISRESQDLYALRSQHKAEQAFHAGKFKDEIIPIKVPQRKGEEIVFKEDEGIRFNQTSESLEKMRPAFKQNGTVTAGNSSTINDAAAILIMMTRSKAKELGLDILATIISTGKSGVNPEIMGIGPILASKKALEKAKLSIEDMDLVEANEAFAAQAICVRDQLGISEEKVNVNGGAIALGHPIGCSGTRIVVSLVHEMIKRQVDYGLATLCIGGGQGNAIIIKR